MMAGRARDQRRAYYMQFGGLTLKKPSRVLTSRFMDQLDACKGDCARRLLLGVGEQFEVPQMFPAVGNSSAVAARVAA